ncbi:hypothetical protein LINPERHAP1_LOCUS12823, partial [Linum perenne]
MSNAADSEEPWYATLANYLSHGIVPPELDFNARKKLFKEAKSYFWDEPFLYRISIDGMIRRCVSYIKAADIIRKCHEGQFGGHFGGNRTARKVVETSFYWPSIFSDCDIFARRCDACQRSGLLNVSRPPVQIERSDLRLGRTGPQ